MTEVSNEYTITRENLLTLAERTTPSSKATAILAETLENPYAPIVMDIYAINLETGVRVLLKNKNELQIVQLLQEGYTLEATR